MLTLLVKKEEISYMNIFFECKENKEEKIKINDDKLS
jgi:Holliday junction resolvase